MVERVGRMPAWLRFAAAALFLNLCLMVRAPARDDKPLTWFIPAPELVVLLVLLGVWVWRRGKLGPVALRVLVAGFLVGRLLRIIDGFMSRHFQREFSLYLDAPLIPEIVPLLRDTVPAWRLALFTLLGIGLFVLLWILVGWALTAAQDYLGRPRRSHWFAAVMVAPSVLPFIISVSSADSARPASSRSAFALTPTGRLVREVDFLLHAYGYRDEKLREIAQVTERIRDRPLEFQRLNGANVYLIFIESYGHSVVGLPEHRQVIEPAWQRMEGRLREQGYFMRSNWLRSPIYGGRSWLAHASLVAGAHVADSYHHSLLLASNARPLPALLRQAGYRTLHVAPGTKRHWPERDFFGFESNYYAWDFGYRGPEFGWATMPDQFVLDFVHQREMAAHADHLFIAFVLISSHAPFAVQPPVIDDWGSIGDGEIYNRLEPVRYPLNWSNLEHSAEAYTRAIVYDLEVLEQYLVRFAQGRALFVVLGDHQPSSVVTHDEEDFSVPIHVLSRSQDLVAPFEGRGYRAGLHPRDARPRPMESFYLDFIEDFDRPLLAPSEPR